jgi:hypothetical protein
MVDSHWEQAKFSNFHLVTRGQRLSREMTSSTLDGDRLLVSAARFLIDGGEEDVANLLLACSLDIIESVDHWWSGNVQLSAVQITISGPRAAYDSMNDARSGMGDRIQEVFKAVLPSGYYISDFIPKAELVDIDPNWREELLEIARGRNVTNQAISLRHQQIRIWENLGFRSQSEIRVAKVLDQRGVLFFPNCKGRVSTPQGRANREPDFLVCHEGKWGILEIDGEPFHPPTRTVQDHSRDRLFHSHGVKLAQHYDATECYETPHKVVDDFLGLLAKI